MINLRERLLQRQRSIPNYFTLEAIESGTFTLTIPSSVPVSYLSYISYSLDNGRTWTRTDNVNSTDVAITTPTVAAGDIVMWKGVGTRMHDLTASTTAGAKFSSTGKFNVYGELLSLLKGDDFTTQRTVESTTGFTFIGLFYQSKVVDASDLIFPDNTAIPPRMAQGMFQGCTELIYGPRQICPEDTTVIYGRGFNTMFQGCTSMISGPEHIYGTTGNLGCCQAMFAQCSSLTTAPVLHQTVIGYYSYFQMFQDCISLTIAPTIVVTEFQDGTSAGATGYECANMFHRCSSLVTADFPLLPTLICDRSYQEMFRECPNLVTGPTINATSIGGRTTPARSMISMFLGDAKLEYSSSFELKIGTLVSSCYSHLFYNCRKINNVKLLATDVSATNCLQNWLYGVASTGTLTATAGLNLPVGVNGKPTNWTLVEI